MLKEILFPSVCLNCQNKVSEFLCEDCYLECMDLEWHISKDVPKDLEYLLYMTKFAGVYKAIVYKGKYKFNKKIWLVLAELMSASLNFKNNSFLSYVPISWLRYCFRGFNQSKVLADQISSKKNVKVLSALKRTGANKSLTTLNKRERRKMVESGFKFTGPDLNTYKYCYLVDDVFTTGATMAAAAKKIKEANPHLKVIGLSFAKTPL